VPLEEQEAKQQRYGTFVPLGHVGSVDDIAWACVYLASDEASFVTGQELVVDGGFLVTGFPRASRSGTARPRGVEQISRWRDPTSAECEADSSYPSQLDLRIAERTSTASAADIASGAADMPIRLALTIDGEAPQLSLNAAIRARRAIRSRRDSAEIQTDE